MRSGRLELSPGSHGEALRERLERWRRESVARRLAQGDESLWPARSEEADERLGWIDLPRSGEDRLGDWIGFAAAERGAGIERVVVLGMGGSSLAPEVFECTFGGARPVVAVLDSTHPDTVRRSAEGLDLERTLFVVSSKSGTTVETVSLFEYFWARAADLADRGRHFVAITDPGSPLERLAKKRRFHRVFTAPPDVGGRYSALSPFGLVPAALTGVDVRELIERGRLAVEHLEAKGARSAPLLELGALLGEAASVGVDKLTVVTSAALESFPDWLEQLIAESTGKEGLGILPIVGEPLREPEEYLDDRIFTGILLEADRGSSVDEALDRLAVAGFPVARVWLPDRIDLGYELVRWEIGVALAGSVLGIDPFSQPDVERAKHLAREVMEGRGETLRAVERIERLAVDELSGSDLDTWLDSPTPVPYVAISAYLPVGDETAAWLTRLRSALWRRSGRRAVTVGIGPRFLHSTGQLHKGGPSGARFLQLVSPAVADVAIPGGDATFGELIAAQADGDAAALTERGQRVLRLRLESVDDLESLVRTAEGPR